MPYTFVTNSAQVSYKRLDVVAFLDIVTHSDLFDTTIVVLVFVVVVVT